MKLVIILGHKDFEDKLFHAIKESRIPMYSKFDILGHVVADKKDLLAWYDSEVDADYSTALFTFIKDSETSQKLMEEIRLLNRSSAIKRPFHAYQMDVDQFV